VASADPQRLQAIDQYWVHGRHPSGRLFAAEVIGVLENECGVWDLETGDLVWRPKARSISWSEDGAAVALLVGTDGEACELRSWPERELIGKCRVRPWACCNTYVALSPRADRAAVLWWHQSEGGVNLVEITDGAARHLQDRGYTTRETNLVQGPAFSRDGSLVAISEGRIWWWLPDENESAEGKPSPGGRFLRGRVTVVDSTQAPYARLKSSRRSKRVGSHRMLAGSTSNCSGSLASFQSARCSLRLSSDRRSDVSCRSRERQLVRGEQELDRGGEFPGDRYFAQGSLSQ
jgi:hypothetical protein